MNAVQEVQGEAPPDGGFMGVSEPKASQPHIQTPSMSSPLPPDRGRRCSKCVFLSPENLICRGRRIPHHQTFQSLEAAALAGCELCRLFLRNAYGYAYSPEKRRIRYEGLRLSNQTLYLSWGYEDLEQLASEPPPLMLIYRTQKVPLSQYRLSQMVHSLMDICKYRCLIFLTL
jgi:hypothetical protein